jgi:hypothetical protein
MRFGKANGWSLVALGVFLVVLQIVLISMPQTDRKASPSPNPPVVAERKISFLPSVLGGICILVGAAFILTSKGDTREAGARPR